MTQGWGWTSCQQVGEGSLQVFYVPLTHDFWVLLSGLCLRGGRGTGGQEMCLLKVLACLQTPKPCPKSGTH